MVSSCWISRWVALQHIFILAVHGQSITRAFLNSSQHITTTTTTSSTTSYSDTYSWTPLQDTEPHTSQSSICIVEYIDGSTIGSCPDDSATAAPSTPYSNTIAITTTSPPKGTTTTDDGSWTPTQRFSSVATYDNTAVSSWDGWTSDLISDEGSTVTPTTTPGNYGGNSNISTTSLPSSSFSSSGNYSTTGPVSQSSSPWWTSSTPTSSSRYGNSSISLTISTQPSSTSHPITTTSSSFSSTPTPTSSSVDCSSCETLLPGQNETVWSLMPNTQTITITIWGNSTAPASLPAWTADPTNATYCPNTCVSTSSTASQLPGSTSSAASIAPTETKTTTGVGITSTSIWGIGPPTSTGTTSVYTYSTSTFAASQTSTNTVTVIVTSKNPVTVYSTAQYPTYPTTAGDKQTTTPTSYSDTYVWSPINGDSGYDTATNTPIPMTQWVNYDLSANGPITQVQDGITVVVYNTVVVIGDETVALGPGTQTITESGDVFTVDSTQLVGPWLIINVPTYTGGVFLETTTSSGPTTVQGVSVSVGSTAADIGGSTYAIGPGASETTIVVSGQTISVGTGGVKFSGTTIPPVQPVQDQTQTTSSNFILVGGDVFTAIGSNTAVIDDVTYTYGPGISTTSKVVDGTTITIGPEGIVYDGTTIGGTSHASGTQYGVVGGVSVTEIGSTIAVINGATITIGPGSPTTTTVINGQTVIAGQSGITIGGATLTYPFITSTQAITAGGITFTEIGSSLAVIGGTTYTFGPKATTAITRTFNGQTISIGTGGIGFATTTITVMTSRPTATNQATHTTTKNGVGALRPGFGVWGVCIAICLGGCLFL